MRIKKIYLVPVALIILAIFFGPDLLSNNSDSVSRVLESVGGEEGGGLETDTHPLSIEYMRQQDYPGSDIVIEQELSPGSNYSRQIVSYKSDGLKIYALMTIPNDRPPEDGFPAIVFNHGYIPPETYRITEKYIAYQDAFARNGYVTIKSDYRGHGNSEGKPEGGYFSPAYTIDVLNAVSSIQKYPDVNDERIGMWGHSMGGHIALRSMVVTDDIKAGVIWGGVTVSYENMVSNWRRSRPWRPSEHEVNSGRNTRQDLEDEYGTFDDDRKFWDSITPIKFLPIISGPIQLHHGENDETVPVEFSETLRDELENAEKEVELFVYEGDNHNISDNLSVALTRSVEFFNKHLK